MKKHHEENYIASAVIWAREHELMARLDNLEGCEDNPVYASEVHKIRKELATIRLISTLNLALSSPSSRLDTYRRVKFAGIKPLQQTLSVALHDNPFRSLAKRGRLW